MEAVQQFNQEMTSLYEVKPPISKAKMTSITKGAIRAIKFYKHVVQSVEKFIQKCKPEYKIPGLYVIDSIVRQSRHQFGPDKDVFAPRFAKNAQVTFYHLYKCSEEEKSKVIRVLNLWQKNGVFTTEDIQPLFDMAKPNSEIYRQLDQQMKTTGKIQVQATVTPVKEEGKTRQESGSAVSNGAGMDKKAMQELQSIKQLLKNPPQVQFNKKLLDFDYSDEEDEGGRDEAVPQSSLNAVQTLLGNPTLLAHLQATGEITQTQIAQLQQLLPGAANQAQPQGGHPQPTPPAGVPPPHSQHGHAGPPQGFPGGLGGIPGLGGGVPPPQQGLQPATGPPPHFLGAHSGQTSSSCASTIQSCLGHGGLPPGYPPHHGVQATPPGFPQHAPVLGMAPPQVGTLIKSLLGWKLGLVLCLPWTQRPSVSPPGHP